MSYTVAYSGTGEGNVDQVTCETEGDVLEEIRTKMAERLIYDPNARVITFSVVDNSKFE